MMTPFRQKSGGGSGFVGCVFCACFAQEQPPLPHTILFSTLTHVGMLESVKDAPLFGPKIGRADREKTHGRVLPKLKSPCNERKHFYCRQERSRVFVSSACFAR